MVDQGELGVGGALLAGWVGYSSGLGLSFGAY